MREGARGNRKESIERYKSTFENKSLSCCVSPYSFVNCHVTRYLLPNVPNVGDEERKRGREKVDREEREPEIHVRSCVGH